MPRWDEGVLAGAARPQQCADGEFAASTARAAGRPAARRIRTIGTVDGRRRWRKSGCWRRSCNALAKARPRGFDIFSAMVRGWGRHPARRLRAHPGSGATLLLGVRCIHAIRSECTASFVSLSPRSASLPPRRVLQEASPGSRKKHCDGRGCARRCIPDRSASRLGGAGDGEIRVGLCELGYRAQQKPQVQDKQVSFPSSREMHGEGKALQALVWL